MKKHLLFLFALLTGMSTARAQFSIKKVLIEEHTGAWCQYCPDGAVVMDDVLSTFQNAIGFAVHNGDAMAIPDGDLLSAFYIAGYPQATIDRLGAGYDRNQWMGVVNTNLQGAGSVTVSFDSMNYDAGTRLVTAIVKAQFTAPMTGDLRFNCVVVEDHVTGTGSGYNQSNYYNTIHTMVPATRL
jgi:hypothetical protein